MTTPKDVNAGNGQVTRLGGVKIAAGMDKQQEEAVKSATRLLRSFSWFAMGIVVLGAAALMGTLFAVGVAAAVWVLRLLGVTYV